MGAGAFRNCTALEKIKYDENAKTLFSRTSFEGTPWEDTYVRENGIVYMGRVAMGVEPDTEPRELTFRDGTICIAHNFLDRETYGKIRTLNIPESVRRIGNYAFNPGYEYGTNIEFVNYPNALEEIGREAFCYNKRIEKLSLPKSVKKVGASAFAAMEKLNSVEWYDIEYSEADVFYNCKALESVKLGIHLRNISVCHDACQYQRNGTKW